MAGLSFTGPVVQRKPWLLFENGHVDPGPISAQLLGLLVLMNGGSSSHSVQSIQLAAEFADPASTSLLKGMIETYTSPLLAAAVLNWSSRFLVAVLSAPILPASFIEPVVSSASATRRRWL